MVLGVLGLILVIFIAESFTTLMSQVLDNNGSVWRLAGLLLLKTPEVIDFALPIALTLGLYFAVAGARDDNELVICAAAGTSWATIPIFAATLGMAALCISLLFSAVITPSSSYMMRLSFHAMEIDGIARKIEGDGPASFIRSLDNRTVIATPSPDPDAKRGNLFLFQEERDGRWRFDQARDWSISGASPDDGFRVTLEGYRTYSGRPGSAEAAPIATVSGGGGVTFGLGNIKVSNLTVDIRSEEVLPVRNRARLGPEVMFLGLLNDGPDAARLSQPTERLASAFARAVLCPFAAMIAIAGAAWSGTRIGRYPSLPVTVLTVLAFDILSRALLGAVAPMGGTAFWVTAGAMTSWALLLPLVYILTRREELLIPRRSRA